MTASNIARWDGSACSALGAVRGIGVLGSLGDLAVFEDGRGPALHTNGGLSWTCDPDPVLEPQESWEGTYLYSTEVVPYGDRFALCYTGWSSIAQIDYATSFDGLTREKWPDNPVLSPAPGCLRADSISVILEVDTVHGWVTNCSDIWHVTSPLELFFEDLETGDTGLWSVVVP